MMSDINSSIVDVIYDNNNNKWIDHNETTYCNTTYSSYEISNSHCSRINLQTPSNNIVDDIDLLVDINEHTPSLSDTQFDVFDDNIPVVSILNVNSPIDLSQFNGCGLFCFYHSVLVHLTNTCNCIIISVIQTDIEDFDDNESPQSTDSTPTTSSTTSSTTSTQPTPPTTSKKPRNQRTSLTTNNIELANEKLRNVYIPILSRTYRSMYRYCTDPTVQQLMCHMLQIDSNKATDTMIHDSTAELINNVTKLDYGTTNEVHENRYFNI